MQFLVIFSVLWAVTSDPVALAPELLPERDNWSAELIGVIGLCLTTRLMK